MNRDDFEKRLERQSLRRIPDEWREEILAAASDGATVRRETSEGRRAAVLPRLRAWLAGLLWPNPQAWAGLAAAWVIIAALNFSLRDRGQALAKNSAPPSPEVVMALRQQQRLLAELIGPQGARAAEPPKVSVPKSRSEGSLGLYVA